MTETSPSHLDLDTLADVLAGEADGRSTGHLDACASCTSRLAELAAAEERVVATLSALPPPPVPDDLAERLTAALAAEAPLQPRRSSVTALPERSERRRSWLPAAAAAVLLVSGAGLGYALLEGPQSRDDAGESAAGAATDDLVLNASGTDYADPAAVTGSLPSVLAGGAGAVELEPATAAGEAQRQAGGDATTEDSSGDAMTSAEAPNASLAGGDLDRLRTPEALLDCLAALLPPEEPETRPLALDYATYAGQPALAVVLPDPDPAKLSVFVVGPGCSRADDSLLHFFRIDAP